MTKIKHASTQPLDEPVAPSRIEDRPPHMPEIRTLPGTDDEITLHMIINTYGFVEVLRSMASLCDDLHTEASKELHVFKGAKGDHRDKVMLLTKQFRRRVAKLATRLRDLAAKDSTKKIKL